MATNYLHWDEKIIEDFSEKNISAMYDRGYVFTRIGKGVMHQTRSVRIDLSKFELSSENRRILRKVENIKTDHAPISYAGYDWTIGRLAKDFYSDKFGDGIMSAQKIKEMITDPSKSNFNLLLIYKDDTSALGYSICHENKMLLHYSYPFYNLQNSPRDMGLGMMIKSIVWAKDSGKRYIYLGSLQRPGDTYKLQFAGLEWFDGGPDGTGTWQTDLETAKKLLKETGRKAE